MSNYKGHTYFNLLFALPLLILASKHGLNLPLPVTATAVGAFVYGTLFMNPDLDLVHQIKLFSLRGLLSLPFRGYSRIFRHRGLSHSLLFGTLTRLLWIALLALVLLVLIYNVDPSAQSFKAYVLKHQAYLLAAFAGFFVADACHLLLDKITA